MGNIFEIDQFALDKEWLVQAGLYHEQAVLVAEKRRELHYLKMELEVIEADLDLAIRRNPKDFGIDKITESVVKSVIIVDAKRKEIQKSIIEKNYEVDINQAALVALEHRKKTLENEVQLSLADYFSTPKQPTNIGKPVQRKKVLNES